MSLDTRVFFALGTQVEDVADVIANLLGHRPEQAIIREGYPDQFWACRTIGKVRAPEGISIPSMVFISVNGEGRDDSFWATYHFETGGGYGSDRIGRSLMIMGMRPRNVAMATRLVDFFGGDVDYCDCDDIDVDYKARRNPLIHSYDDEAYHRWQRAKFDVQPITEAELDAAEGVCAR